MKHRVAQIVTALLLCVFVNFVFGNMAFTHSHTFIDGHSETHSHPYMPGHSHSAKTFDQIAIFNASALGMEATSTTVFLSESTSFISIADMLPCVLVAQDISYNTLRGPPATV